MALDSIKWYPVVQVKKYNPDTVRDITKLLGHEPSGPELRKLEEEQGLTWDDEAWAYGNQLVTVGLNRIGNLIIGTGAAFTSTQAIVGVGSSSTAFAASQTALSGDGSTTTAYYQLADSAPTQSNGVITANATFATGNGNFAWNEWCWAIATGTITAGGTLASVGTTPVMLNRKVQSLGTKASGSTWTLQATITLS